MPAAAGAELTGADDAAVTAVEAVGVTDAAELVDGAALVGAELDPFVLAVL